MGKMIDTHALDPPQKTDELAEMFKTQKTGDELNCVAVIMIQHYVIVSTVFRSTLI